MARTVGPRRRYLTLTVVTGTLAEALTAAPALGGIVIARLAIAVRRGNDLFAHGDDGDAVDESHNVNRAQTAVGLSARELDYAAVAEECMRCVKDTAFVCE